MALTFKRPSDNITKPFHMGPQQGFFSPVLFEPIEWDWVWLRCREVSHLEVGVLTLVGVAALQRSSCRDVLGRVLGEGRSCAAPGFRSDRSAGCSLSAHGQLPPSWIQPLFAASLRTAQAASGSAIFQEELWSEVPVWGHCMEHPLSKWNWVNHKGQEG